MTQKGAGITKILAKYESKIVNPIPLPYSSQGYSSGLPSTKRRRFGTQPANCFQISLEQHESTKADPYYGKYG